MTGQSATEPYLVTILHTFDRFAGQELNGDQAMALADQLRDFDDEKTDDLWYELVPVLERRFSPDPSLAEAFSAQPQWASSARLLCGEEGLRTRIETFNRLLLYYPRVVVCPPAVVLGMGFRFEPALGHLVARPMPGRGLAGRWVFVLEYVLRMLAPLFQLRKLAEEGIVVGVPVFDEPTANLVRMEIRRLGPAVFSALERENAFERAEVVDALRTLFFEEGITRLSTRAALRRLIGRSLQEILGPEMGSFNWIADNEALWKVLRGRLRGAGSVETSGQEATYRFGEMVRAIELPNIASLSAQDIIAIRTDDSVFESWRAGLRELLRQSLKADLNASNFSTEFKERANDALWPRAEMLRNHVRRRQSLRSRVTEVSLAFSLAALGGAIGWWVAESPAGAAAGATVGGALGEGLPRLADHARGLSRPRAERALLAHYSLLCESPPGAKLGGRSSVY